MRPALIVFGRNPIPGHVKTRLARSIGDESAANLYRAFLLDSLAAFGTLEVDIKLYLAPSDSAVDPKITAANPDYLLQSGNGLGDRMSNAFRELFEAGYSKVGIVGSDHPSLPVEMLQRGFALLGERNVVLGPAEDGGYYFLALSRRQPSLFSGIRYGGHDVLRITLQRAVEAGLRSTLLDYWYDVDTIEDLHRLAEELGADSSICPEIRDTMKRSGIL